jgi:holo-[acyl-carrier protein] synthase
MLAIGIDMIAIPRVQAVIDRHDGRFLRRVYTPEEVAFCRGRVAELAARFAAKEAVMKALGTGARGVAWREIEVLPDRRGKPLVYLYGRAKERADKIGLRALDVSLTHERDFAVAAVAGVRDGPAEDAQESRARLVKRLKDRGLL